MLSESFASALRRSRQELNAHFVEARQRFSALDPDTFGKFLRDTVDPLVRAVDTVCPDRAESVALAAYDVALELVGQRLAGPGARGTAIDSTWRRVPMAAPRLLAAEPSRVLASLSNAAHQLESTAGARASAWVDDMTRLAGRCGRVDELLAIGQVAAWRAGLAHYRRGAIAAAASLPEPLALAAVAASPSGRWSEIEAGLLASEWFDPAGADGERTSRGPGLPHVAMVGAFRGFGGLFLAPPRVTFADGHFHVLSGEERWLLTADRYGATFHRVAPGEAELPKLVTSLPAGVRAPQGPGAITSAACSETTLALTWSQSHRLMLVARQ